MSRGVRRHDTPAVDANADTPVVDEPQKSFARVALDRMLELV